MPKSEIQAKIKKPNLKVKNQKLTFTSENKKYQSKEIIKIINLKKK